ncbi:uncharacterized protein LOC123549230 [Mercenaria mercenaria]|uniref:uncharacterized protein LOC123549230 n=1 Tax=Mercenaria mercenaria TaxID=6596 RepID=UPI00234F9C28|nr:uncharacterized protein LOC123549230 [Mercenaria mercenaria]
MATKEDPTQLDKESGVYTICLPCTEAGRTMEAIRYCMECKSHLCEQCLQDHNKFAALRKHHTVDKSEAAEHKGESDKSEGNTAIECGSHQGQYIDSYCKDHNEVCCSICITIKHRSCKHTEKILKVANGIKESKEISDTKLSLEQFLDVANKEKVDRNKNLTGLDEEKTKILEDIDTYEKIIIERIRLIAETSRENIRDAHSKHVKKGKSDIKDLDTVMSVMSGLKDSLNKLNETDINEVEAFMSIKNCQKAFAEVKVAMDDLSDKWLQTELHYTFKNDIIHKDIKAFGDVTEEEKKDRVWRFTCKRKVNIRIKTDISTCRIKGICQLDDGTYVITDSSNANIKRLNCNLEVTDYIKLDNCPGSLCVTGPKEVAVTLPEKNLIQFVKTDERLSLGPSFSTAPGRCSVINYDSREEKLYVCCTYVTAGDYNKKKYGTISVYSKDGTLWTTFEKDSKGLTVLFKPYQIFLETDVILVLDVYKKAMVFKKTPEGQLERIRQEMSGFSQPVYGVSGKCLCLLSKTVMLSQNGHWGLCLNSMEGRLIKDLEMENSSMVLAAYFNKQRSTLVVGAFCEICEYKMPLKILLLLENKSAVSEEELPKKKYK